MEKEIIKRDNVNLYELPFETVQIVEESTPQEEYENLIAKRRLGTFLFVLFIIAECLMCLVMYMSIKVDDLHIRVMRQYENEITGQNILTNGIYIGDTDFAHFIGEGTFEYKTGAVYSGQWAQNKMNGIGQLKIPNEGTYNGNFKNSVKNGEGIFIWDDGTIYDGRWKNDQMDGQGIYISFDGIQYDGIFHCNRFESGKCIFENDTGSYIIEYKNFEISNISISFSDGTIYSGFCDGENLSGTGMMNFPNGDQYSGKYEDGLREGEGIYTWDNGDVYNGLWHKDAMSGTGSYVYKDGSSAKGTFKSNLFIDGSYTVLTSFGKYIFTIKDRKAVSVNMELTNGTIYIGSICDGALTGTTQIVYSNGDKYSGMVVEGFKSGSGVYTWNSGAYYDGEWSEDKMNGNGSYYYPEDATGYKLIGNFEKGKPEGECWYYVTANELYKTDWSNGVCIKVYE